MKGTSEEGAGRGGREEASGGGIERGREGQRRETSREVS